MEIKLLATNQNFEYEISGTTINDIDLSVIPPDTNISPLPQELSDAGIRAVYTDETGELFVTLQQRGIAYQYPGIISHDWKGGSWIPAEEYDPNVCYIVPMSVQDKHDYKIAWATRTVKKPDGTVAYTENGWTVRKLEAEQ